MGIIIISKDRDRLAGADAIAVEIGPHRARRHDARTVIVGKRHGPLQRTGGQDRLLGHDTPERFDRPFRGRLQMLANPLQRAIGTLIISAGDRGACHQAHIGQR